MVNKETSKKQGCEFHEPLLFTPGQQGWKTPEPNKLLLPKAFRRENILTTREMEELLGVSSKDLRQCPTRAILGWNDYAYLIWHKGRNSWKVYEEKLTV